MFKRAKEIIQEGLDAKLFSGAALGIIQGGEVVVEEYYGHTSFEEKAKSVDKKTLFDMASCSKIVATTSIALRFLDRGLFRLDDKVGYFFPEAKEVKDVTIRQLLTHTSGEPAHFLLSKECESKEEVLPCLLERPLANKPGEVEAYSCMGFILLGEILKKVSGKDLETLLKEEILDVLGLKSTMYGPVDTKKHSVAKTKDLATREVLEGVVHDENARFQDGKSANAGLFANLRDMLRYAEVLLANGKTTKETFISPRTLAIAKENYTAGLNEDRGLGFFLGSTRNSSFGDLFGAQSFGHTGFTGTSIVIHQEEDIAVVILTNRVIVEEDGMEVVRMRARAHNSIMAEVSAKK